MSTRWQTGDLARIAAERAVWEIQTFWTAPDGQAMVTLERAEGSGFTSGSAPVSCLVAP